MSVVRLFLTTTYQTGRGKGISARVSGTQEKRKGPVCVNCNCKTLTLESATASLIDGNTEEVHDVKNPEDEFCM